MGEPSIVQGGVNARHSREEFTLGQALTLSGGVVRRLLPADLAGFRDHLLRLDPDSRQDRFGMAVSDDFLRNYAERCFGIDDVIYGFVVEGIVRGAGELRGIGYNLPLGFGGSAEAAFSVETGWRRQGVGAELMSRIVRAARNRRAETLYMSCLVNNRAMLQLANFSTATTSLSLSMFFRFMANGAISKQTLKLLFKQAFLVRMHSLSKMVLLLIWSITLLK
jgi:GNAT superfamily N-acetyltransferase